MVKRVIFNPFNTIPKSDKSHVKGWALIWAQRLNADIADKDTDLSKYDELYFDHGANFNGNLNLFGGLNDEIYYRLKTMVDLVNQGVTLFSIAIPFSEINYIDQMRKRIGSKTTSKFINEAFLSKAANCFDFVQTCTMSQFNLDKAIIGDSHSIAFSTEDQAVYKNDGKTLFNFMKTGSSILKNTLSENNISELDLCFGSIDIRHHTLRLGIKPEKFADDYIDKALLLQDDFGIPINLCCPVPIEYEGRKIPGTGMYKGRPFYGSQKDRRDFTIRFIDRLFDAHIMDGLGLIKPPENWYTMDPEKYAKEIMELSSSVHIAPKNYRSVIDWKN